MNDDDDDALASGSIDWVEVRFYAVMLVFAGVGIFCIVNAVRVLLA